MLRRLLLAVIIIASLPAWAHATWYISASTSPASGAGTISPSGSVGFPDTTLSANFTVSPVPGYVISSVRLSGSTLTPVSPGVYTVSKAASTRSLVAYLTPKTYAVTVTVISGGAIVPAFTTPTTSLLAGSNYTFNIVPSTGYMVTDVLVDGLSIGPVNSYTFSGISANHTLSAIFATMPKVVAVASPAEQQTPGLGPAYAVTVNGSQSTTTVGSLAYRWAVTATSPAGLTGGFDDATKAKPLFYANQPGTYTITLTASDGLGNSSSAQTKVKAQTRQAFLSLYCESCHSGRSAQTVAAYDASLHHDTTLGQPSCQACHLPGEPDTEHYTIHEPVDSCKGCHTSFPPNTPGHINGVSGSCVSCHDAHSLLATGFNGSVPHFNNATSGAYPASYVTASIGCAKCHSPDSDTQAAEQNRRSWAKSGHGATRDAAWTAYDFKRYPGCARCHTTTGFIAYSSGRFAGAWGNSQDKTKEVLACNACHRADFTLRAFKAYSSATAYLFAVDAANTISLPLKYADYASSNNCFPCHTGTVNGELIKRAFAFANFTAAGRLLNHFMVGGGVLDNNIGYEFEDTPRGKAIDFNKQNTWHSGIGLAASAVDTGTAGACVACHMSAPGQGHSFAAVFTNLTGSIVAIASQSVCDKCHPSELGGGTRMSKAQLDSSKSGMEAGLAVLKAQLAASGFDPDSQTRINWGSTQQVRANNLGAYYNYFLLKKSDRAAYIHNPVYARRLIQYSLDWLDNGEMDDSAAAAIQAVNGVSSDTRTRALGYLGLANPSAVNCVDCHKDYYN